MNESRIVATERLRREGRWNEASSFRDDERRRLRSEGRSRADAIELSWRSMLAKFPAVENVQHDDGMAAGRDERSLIVRLSAEAAPDLVRDAFWVYGNLDNKMADPEEAPTLGAWSMLCWARGNRNRFFEHMLPKAIAFWSKARGAATNAQEGVCQRDEIERMLEAAL